MSEAWGTAESRVGKRSPSTWIVSTLTGLTIAATASVLYWFDPNRYGFYPVCLFHQATGLLCPGCGALRAVHQLLHGHISTAFLYNPMLVTGLLVSMVLGTAMWIARLRDKSVGFAFPRKCLLLMVAIGLLVSIWRNFQGCPLTIPGF